MDIDCGISCGENDGQGYIPFKYYSDFLKFLSSNKNIEVITYDDFDWGEDFDYENSYLSEFKSWSRKIKEGDLDKDKIYVLIQHDVDTAPERTLAVLREEERFSIRSNVMFFNKRVDRRYYQKTNILRYTDYEIDFDEYNRLQEKGFVFGYHSNALDQAFFDNKKAQKIFEEDVAVLSEKLNSQIRYFSPHGGLKSPAGFTNNSLPVPESLKGQIRWVANRRTVRFKASYSDGGINSLSRDPSKRDLRDFVRSWCPGNRYRVLTHPQYYTSPCGRSPRLSGVSWYEDVLSAYSSGYGGSVWGDVEPIYVRKSFLKRLLKRN